MECHRRHRFLKLKNQKYSKLTGNYNLRYYILTASQKWAKQFREREKKSNVMHIRTQLQKNSDKINTRYVINIDAVFQVFQEHKINAKR